MKKQILTRGLIGALVLLALVACRDRQKSGSPSATVQNTEKSEADSTMYGRCGEGTTMHTLELVTDEGDTLTYVVNEDANDKPTVVGGLMAGDKLAVTATTLNGELTATRVINLTTLMGKWTSIDKNFELEDGGEVISYVKAEQHPWTSWRIVNGRLALNRDTFDITTLGPDSLFLENQQGIFVYKREH